MKKPRRTRFKKTVMAVLLSGAGFFGFQAADVNDGNTKPVTDPVTTTTTTTNLYTLNAKEDFNYNSNYVWDLHTLATEQQRAEEERHFKWIESVGKMQPAALNNELIIAAMDNEPDRIRYLVNTMKADIHTEDNEALASAIHFNNYNAAKTLLDLGADPRARNDSMIMLAETLEMTQLISAHRMEGPGPFLWGP